MARPKCQRAVGGAVGGELAGIEKRVRGRRGQTGCERLGLKRDVETCQTRQLHVAELDLSQREFDGGLDQMLRLSPERSGVEMCAWADRARVSGLERPRFLGDQAGVGD